MAHFDAILFVYHNAAKSLIYTQFHQAVCLIANASFRLQAKTTKKIVLRLECTACKHKRHVPIKRCKHFELGGDKRRKGVMIQF